MLTNPEVVIFLETFQEAFPLRVTADSSVVGPWRRKSAPGAQNLKAVSLKVEPKHRHEASCYTENTKVCAHNQSMRRWRQRKRINQFHAKLMGFVVRMSARRKVKATPPIWRELLLLQLGIEAAGKRNLEMSKGES